MMLRQRRAMEYIAIATAIINKIPGLPLAVITITGYHEKCVLFWHINLGGLKNYEHHQLFAEQVSIIGSATYSMRLKREDGGYEATPMASVSMLIYVFWHVYKY